MKTLLLLLLPVMISCAETSEFFCEPTNYPKEIKYQIIAFEPVKLDSINTSYLGITLQKKDKILFVDKLFSFVYEFDTNGKLLGRYGGIGNSMTEFPLYEIEACAINSNNELHFFDASNNWVICDDNYIRINQNTPRLVRKKTSDSLYESANSYAFMYQKMSMKIYGNRGFIPVFADKHEFNIFTPDFLKETRVIGQIDLEKAQVVKALGRTSNQFAKSEGNIFYCISFDIDQTNGDFYTTFELDSLVYVYDKNYNIKRSFGYSGADMDTKYTKLDQTNIREQYPLQRAEKGYYNKISMLNGKIFRSYKKGAHSEYDGLQIYENGVLVADVETPKDANPVAYIAPYYYCEIICNEDAQTLTLYRFKLN